MPKLEIKPGCEVTRLPLDKVVVPDYLSHNNTPAMSDSELYASIAAYGITTACVGRLKEDGTVELLSGSRRVNTLERVPEGQLEADATLVPVHVFTGMPDAHAGVVTTATNLFTDAGMLPSQQREGLAAFESWVAGVKKDSPEWLPTTREYRSAEVCAMVTGRSVRTIFLLLGLQRDVMPGLLEYMDVGFLSIHRAKDLMKWSGERQKKLYEAVRQAKPTSKAEFNTCLNNFMAGQGGEEYLAEALALVRKAADYVEEEPTAEVMAIANDIRLQLKSFFPKL